MMPNPNDNPPTLSLAFLPYLRRSPPISPKSKEQDHWKLQTKRWMCLFAHRNIEHHTSSVIKPSLKTHTETHVTARGDLAASVFISLSKLIFLSCFNYFTPLFSNASLPSFRHPIPLCCEGISGAVWTVGNTTQARSATVHTHTQTLSGRLVKQFSDHISAMTPSWEELSVCACSSIAQDVMCTVRFVYMKFKLCVVVCAGTDMSSKGQSNS